MDDADDNEGKLIASAEKGWTSYQKALQQVLALGREKKQTDAADISDGAGSMAIDELQGALSELIKFNFEGLKSQLNMPSAPTIRL